MRARAGLAALLAVMCCLAVSPSTSHAQKKKKPQRDLVTRDEIMESAQREDDLYAALRSLRPRFLEPPTGVRSMVNGGPAPTMVIIDGKPMGNLETLRSITASTVEEARYVEPGKAGMEYGQSASGGAVVVKLYHGQKVTKTPADSAKPSTR